MSRGALDSPSAVRTGFGVEHTALRESFRTFLEREVRPAYQQWGTAGAIPRDLLKLAGEYGFLGMRVPEAFGGAGVDDPRFGAVIGEEAMRARATALALALVTHNDIAVPSILRSGDEVTARWAPGLASGDTLATIAQGAFTLADQRVTGRADAVVAGAQADLVVVVAGHALTLVARDAEGVSVSTCDEPIGLEPAGLASLRFDHAPCSPLSAGAADLASDQALALAITGLAGARAALDITVAYVTERRAFGQPLSAFQNTHRLLGGIAADIENGTAVVDALLERQAAGELRPHSAAAAKLLCTECYGRAVDAGVQLHGGYGYIMEYEIAHQYADARFWRLHEPENEALKDSIAGSLFA